MSDRRRLRWSRWLQLATFVLVVVSLVAVAGAASAVTDSASPPVSSADNESLPVTLITGETVQFHGEDDDFDDAFPPEFDRERVDPELFNVSRLVTEGYYRPETGAVPVIVEFDDSDVELHAGVSAIGFESERTYRIIDGAAGTLSADSADRALTPETLDKLGIERITLDRQFELTTDTSPGEIQADIARSKFGVSGSHVNVSVIDSGIDSSHPDFGDRIIVEEDYTSSTTGNDSNGHGTHVAGTVAGDGTYANGTYTSVAPGANLFNMRVFPGGFESWIIAAIDQSVDSGADVISMSLGGPGGPDNPLNHAAENAIDEGVVVVTSAGNTGPEYETLTAPANSPEVITVANGDTLNRVHEEDIAFLSSRGPTEEFAVQPTVTAPGTEITATGSRKAGEFPYSVKSGTSMAAPHVSGVVALMLEKNPALTPAEIKSALVTTATPLETANGTTSADVYSAGAGQINATRALDPPLSVDRTQLGFDVQEFGEQQSRVVSVENRQNETVTLEVNTTLEHVDENATSNLTANRTQFDLLPGTSTAVELTVDASATTAGLYGGTVTFTAHNSTYGTIVTGYEQPDSPSRFDVTDIEVDEQIPEGDSVIVTATVENLDDSADTQRVEALVNDTAVANTTVTLGSGENTTVTFDVDTWKQQMRAGNHTVGVATSNSNMTTTVQVTPTTVTYADANGTVESDGVLTAIGDWRADTITTDLLLEVIRTWRDGGSAV